MYSIFVGILFGFLIILYEYKIITKIQEILNKYKIRKPLKNTNEDNDVLEERLRIQSNNIHNLKQHYILILKNITKYYNNFIAVNDISLGIKPFECFGLLGVNGAGKTTTFEMMTGDLKISHGDAWVNGFSINRQLADVQKLIG